MTRTDSAPAIRDETGRDETGRDQMARETGRDQPSREETGRIAWTVAPAGPAIDPIALFAAAVEAGLEVALWLRPSEQFALVGIGRAWAIETDGSERFRTTELAFRDAVAGPRSAGIDLGLGPSPGPILIGGLGFSGRRPAASDCWTPFGAASLAVPSLTFRSDGAEPPEVIVAVVRDDPEQPGRHEIERTWTRLVARAADLESTQRSIVTRSVDVPLTFVGSQPDHGTWRRIVGLSAGAVGRGRIDKVVLARRVELSAPVDLDVPNALRRLAASAPESTIYAFRRDGRTFLGATPERLVRTEGRRFRTVALAGTIRRGADANEDAALAAQLLASDKDREEQRIVVAGIRERLTPIAETLEIERRPSVLPLRYVQHLRTEISGTLPPGHGLLSLAAALHPTPAVGGEPREAALAMIDEHEGFDRGWYAGPIGWLDGRGDGELCVALRGGIVERRGATLFAGCGIVADSDPESEWEESRIKLRSLIAAFGIAAEEP